MGKRGATTPAETVEAIMEYAVTHPDLSRNAVAKRFDLNGSVIYGWCNRASAGTRGAAKQWLQTANNLERWEGSRPTTPLAPALRAMVLAGRDVGASPVSHTNGTFLPQSSGDLLVVREDILALQQNAQQIACEAQVLVIAIDTVRDWLDDRQKLESALGRVQALEAQLEAANKAIQTFQDQKIRENLVVHSRD